MSLPPYITRVLLLGLALLVWGNTVAYRQTTQTIALPVRVTNLASGLAIGSLPPEINVRLAGSAKSLSRINDATLSFVLDLGGARLGGSHTAAVAMVGQPTGVTILSWEPKQITLPIDEAITTSLPISLQTSGSLADGYKLVSLTANPDQVSITGSANLIRSLNTAIATIDLTRRRSSFSYPAAVSLGQDDLLAGLPLSPTSITITAEIAQGDASRIIGIKPRFKGQIEGGYFIRSVKFDPPIVTLLGNDRALTAVQDLFSTPIDLSGRRQTFSDEVGIDLPKGIRVDGKNLIRATVDIQLAEASREFSVAPQFINVSDGFTVKAVTPKAIQVVLVGEEAALKQLTRSQIQLKVDLSGILSGGTRITLTSGMFELPSGISVGSFTPEEIEVILARSE